MTKLFMFILLAVLCLGFNAYADVFNLGPGVKNLETVTVGDPGNTPDGTRGSVAYTYNIGKYEVTAGQYCDFLNQKAKLDAYGLYNTKMTDLYGCGIERTGTSGNYSYGISSGLANKPVNYVSYWDSVRFINWLNNGQGIGDTETGAYTLNGHNNSENYMVSRNTSATWFLPTVDEWHKAAYYKGGGTDSGYWKFSTQSDIAPGNLVSDAANQANYNHFDSGTSIVGACSNSASAYGTFDQGGNIWEFNQQFDDSHTYMRGGSWQYGSEMLRDPSLYYIYTYPPNGNHSTVETSDMGFRVASAAVPEPSSVLALLGGLGSVFALRRRKA